MDWDAKALRGGESDANISQEETGEVDIGWDAKTIVEDELDETAYLLWNSKSY